MARSPPLPLLAAALLGAVMLGARPALLLALPRRISRQQCADKHAFAKKAANHHCSKEA